MNKLTARHRRCSLKTQLLKLASIALACAVLANALTELIKAVYNLLRAIGIR